MERLFVGLALVRVVLTSSASTEHAFCVVGAGPGGVQMGHYLSKSRDAEMRDYIIFERASSAGYFFRKYPKHRELISINKRHLSPGHGPDYNFRQDWNTLIGRPEVTPMTQRTRKFFPDADLLASYIEEFASEQADAGRIQFNTSVENIKKVEKGFEVTVQSNSEQPVVQRCGHVIMANGLWTPKKNVSGFLKGSELMLGYDELPTYNKDSEESVKEWEDLFEGKDVAILGLGNAAMEVAQAILPMAASVHMVGHSEGRYSDKTHYPGDIRANRREILDHYQLKMTSTISSDDGMKAVVPCFEDKLCLLYDSEEFEFFVDGEGHDAGMELLTLLRNKTAKGQLIQHKDWNHVNAKKSQVAFNAHMMENKKAKAMYAQLDTPKEVIPSGDSITVELKALLRSQNKDLLELALKHRLTLSMHGNRDPMDVVIRCTGWKHNLTVYDDSAMPKLMSNLKHAAVSDSYESINVPGLFFAGTLAHGPDFRKSAGGFIHGFRYTSRALSRILEFHRGHGWRGQRDFQLPQDFSALQEHMLWRIRESSGPYHMFDQLIDGIVFSAANCTASYREEMPKAFFHNTFREMPRLEWVFNYAPPGFKRDYELEESAAQYHQRGYNDPFLHPIMRFFNSSDNSTAEIAKPKIVHIHADFFTRWISETASVSVVRRFLEYAVRESFGAASCSSVEAISLNGSCTAGGGCTAAEEEEAAKAALLSSE